MTRKNIFTFFIVAAFTFIDLCSVQALPVKRWGSIMYVHAKTNIRAKRSLDAKIRGFLMPGQAVKVDFLNDDWYAVFKITQKVRSEKKAMGYVYAPRLFKTPSPERIVLPEKKEEHTTVTRTAEVAVPEKKGETAAAAKPVKYTASEKKEESAAITKPAEDTISIEVKSIRFNVLPEGKEVILLEFNRFYMPAVYYLEGNSPMIIMDVTCTSSIKREWSEMQVNGTLIKKIRVSLNPIANILRIALDMVPTKNYDVKPVLYTSDNVYSIEVVSIATPQK